MKDRNVKQATLMSDTSGRGRGNEESEESEYG
jgi:hypothetical protein